MTVNVSKPRQVAYADQVYNPNLLINTCFEKGYLVNQRGQNIYRQPEGYIVDMLRCCVVGEDRSKSEVIVTDDGLQYNLNGASYFHNYWYLDNDVIGGKIVTLSAEVDGVVYTLTCDFTQEPFTETNSFYFNGASRISIIYWTEAKRFQVEVVFYGDYLLGGLKLEDGPISTYGRNVPDYAETLAKCQRYLYILSGNATPYPAYLYNQINVVATIYTPVTMRTIPTMVGSPFSVYIDGVLSTTNDCHAGKICGNAVQVWLTLDTPIAGVTESKNVVCAVNNDGAATFLSAEL